MAFLSAEKLEKLTENIVTDTIKWRELPEKVWYKITNISDEKKGEYGSSYILTLADRENNYYEVWSISNLINKLKIKLGSDFNRFDEYDIYTRSKGLRVSIKEKEYFDFKVVFSEKKRLLILIVKKVTIKIAMI